MTLLPPAKDPPAAAQMHLMLPGPHLHEFRLRDGLTQTQRGGCRVVESNAAFGKSPFR
jgi:hypothetical protein